MTPTVARAAVDEEQLGGGAAPLAHRGEREALPQPLEDLALRHHQRAVPGVLRVERHLLDEAQLVAAVEAPLQQVGHVGVVDAAHGDGVDLDRGQPGIRGGLEAGHDVVEPVAAGEPAEVLGVDRVEADVDPVQARRRPAGRRAGRARCRWSSSRCAAAARGAAMRPTTSTRLRRSSGSPPVSRTWVMPRPTITVTSRTSSSSVSISGLGSQSRPSAGMQ